MESLEKNRSLALAFLDHAFGLEVEKALALLAEDATWWVLGDPSRLGVSGQRDYSRIRRLLETLRKGFPDGMKHQIRGTTTEGNRVAVEVEATAIAGNGQSYHNSYHFLIVVDNGQIRAVREYMDTLEVLSFQG